MKKIDIWLLREVMFSKIISRKIDAWLDVTEIFQVCIVSGEFSVVEGTKQSTVKADGLLLPPTKFCMSKLSFIQS